VADSKIDGPGGMDTENTGGKKKKVLAQPNHRRL